MEDTESSLTFFTDVRLHAGTVIAGPAVRRHVHAIIQSLGLIEILLPGHEARGGIGGSVCPRPSRSSTGGIGAVCRGRPFPQAHPRRLHGDGGCHTG
jgi:hypothetical protein